jgi:aspartate aminotransferase-like enzyme
MGAVTESDVLVTIGAVEKALVQAGYRFDPGAGLTAAQGVLTR